MQKECRRAVATFNQENVFGSKFAGIRHCAVAFFRQSASASAEVVHRPRSVSPLLFDPRNIWQIRTENSNANARRLLPAVLLERWSHVCCVKITLALRLTN